MILHNFDRKKCHFTNTIYSLGGEDRCSGPYLFFVYMPWLPPPTRHMNHTKTFAFEDIKEIFITFDEKPIILYFCSHTHTHID
jgi:hypothetical protein